RRPRPASRTGTYRQSYSRAPASIALLNEIAGRRPPGPINPPETRRRRAVRRPVFRLIRPENRRLPALVVTRAVAALGPGAFAGRLLIPIGLAVARLE